LTLLLFCDGIASVLSEERLKKIIVIIVAPGEAKVCSPGEGLLCLDPAWITDVAPLIAERLRGVVFTAVYFGMRQPAQDTCIALARLGLFKGVLCEPRPELDNLSRAQKDVIDDVVDFVNYLVKTHRGGDAICLIPAIAKAIIYQALPSIEAEIKGMVGDESIFLEPLAVLMLDPSTRTFERVSDA
jgi:hypothetical protein